MSRDLEQRKARERAKHDANKAALRPSVLYRPELVRNEVGWLASYGGSEGCNAVGSTPAEAMANFDKLWTEPPATDADKVLGGEPVREAAKEKKKSDVEADDAADEKLVLPDDEKPKKGKKKAKAKSKAAKK